MTQPQQENGVRWLPVKITKGHRWAMRGYQCVWQKGKVIWATDDQGYACDGGGVKFQVWVAGWLCRLLTAPEIGWRRIVERLWHSRLAEQYDAGYAAGLHEAYYNRDIYERLFTAERAAVFGVNLSEKLAEAADEFDRIRWGVTDEQIARSPTLQKVKADAEAAEQQIRNRK